MHCHSGNGKGGGLGIGRRLFERAGGHLVQRDCSRAVHGTGRRGVRFGRAYAFLSLCNFLGVLSRFLRIGLGEGHGEVHNEPPNADGGRQTWNVLYILLVMIYLGRIRVMNKPKKKSGNGKGGGLGIRRVASTNSNARKSCQAILFNDQGVSLSFYGYY